MTSLSSSPSTQQASSLFSKSTVPIVATSTASRSLPKTAMQVIYPQYIDATLTPRDGRRLTKTQSVTNPTLEEIAIALGELGYKQMQIDHSKSYPRSQGSLKFPVVPRGCVRVAIKAPRDEHYIKKSEFDKETRNCIVKDIESKQELLRRVAVSIKAKGEARKQRLSITEAVASLTQPSAAKARR